MGELNWSAQQQLRNLERAATAAQGAGDEIAQLLLRGPALRGPTGMRRIGTQLAKPPRKTLRIGSMRLFLAEPKFKERRLDGHKQT